MNKKSTLFPQRGEQSKGKQMILHKGPFKYYISKRVLGGFLTQLNWGTTPSVNCKIGTYLKVPYLQIDANILWTFEPLRRLQIVELSLSWGATFQELGNLPTIPKYRQVVYLLANIKLCLSTLKYLINEFTRLTIAVLSS